jgi:outer membrane biosynthesis protein TonB
MLKRAVVALFLVAVASGPVAGQGSRQTQTLTFQKDAVREDTAGLVKPIVVQSVRPQYSAEAMRSRVHGSVGVQVVVGADGAVDRARVVTVAWSVIGDFESPTAWSADTDSAAPFTQGTPGLMANALTAAKAWKFKPGTLNGAPVPVLTTLTLTFDVH